MPRRSDRLKLLKNEEPPVELPEQDASLTEEEQIRLVRRLFLDKRFPGSFSGELYFVVYLRSS